MKDELFDLQKLVKKLFWLLGLPLTVGAFFYCCWRGTNPFDSLLFSFSFMLCVPMLLLKASEPEESSYQHFLDEFRAMTSSEFFEKEEEIMSSPLNKNMSMIKEAYKHVYKEKYGRDI